MKLSGALVFILATLPATLQAGELTVRIVPSDVIYTNENNRRIGIHDLMVQTISVINESSEAVSLQEIVIDAEEAGDVILTDRLLARNYAPVWKAFFPYWSTPEGQSADDTLVLFSQALPDGIVLSPTLDLEPGTAVLVRNRLLAFSGYLLPDRVEVRVLARNASDEEITAVASIPVQKYVANNEYRFPVAGRWYISSSSSIRSHHRARPAHEFALDLMKIGADGKSFRSDGSFPADYFAYAEPVYAVADGKVIATEGEIPDTEMPRQDEPRNEFARRVLGAMWEEDPSGRIAGGNFVVIEHPGGEYSNYVHLRPGSVNVKVGDLVRQGQQIGQVGISGDGFEPHLHFSVSDTPEMNYGHGLPVTFSNVEPIGFSSTLDMAGERLYFSGEFVRAIKPQ